MTRSIDLFDSETNAPEAAPDTAARCRARAASNTEQSQTMSSESDKMLIEDNAAIWTAQAAVLQCMEDAAANLCITDTFLASEAF